MTTASLKIGAFGTGNLGDDLMLQAILLSEPQARVIAYGKPLLPFDVPYIDYAEFLSDPASYLKECSALDFGGGNLFWSAENLSDMLVLTQQAKLVGVPVSLNRIGLHGYEVREHYARLLLKLVDRVSVRDKQSYAIARKLQRTDCELKRDYVFDLISARKLDAQPGRKPAKVGINISDWRLTSIGGDSEGFRNHIGGIFAGIAQSFREQLEFYYLPFCVHRTHAPSNDLLVGNFLWERSEGLITYVDSVLTTEDLLKAVESMDILIGHRFHLQVLGYAMNKHVIPLVEDERLGSKHSAIAADHGVMPISYEGSSQAFIQHRIEMRLRQFMADGRVSDSF